MNRVRWSQAATTDLHNLRNYYADSGDVVGQRIIERIVLATDWLSDWPYAGAEIGASGWRKWKPRRTPHILVYPPIAGGIEISRIRHGRENWVAEL